jgi:hypothetical protein
MSIWSAENLCQGGMQSGSRVEIRHVMVCSVLFQIVPQAFVSTLTALKYVQYMKRSPRNNTW